MKQLFWHRLDLWARALFPFLITLFLAILAALPLRLPAFSTIMPALTLIAVYYWVVHRPDLMPAWAVGFLGLFQDLLIGGPTGVTIVVFLFIYGVVAWQRKLFASASFALIWAIFMALAAAALGLTWLLTMLSNMTYFNPQPLLFQFVLTIAVYPFFAWIMIQGQRFFDA